MHPSSERARPIAQIAVAIAAAVLLGGCASDAGRSASEPTVPASHAPSIVASASPSLTPFPTALIGTWIGEEEDANFGVTWQTTYRIEACRQFIEPWKPPADDQRCGDWTGAAMIEGLPARCTATLSWLESNDDAFVFLASGPEGSSKYRTIPHPYLDIDGKWYCWDTFRVRMAPNDRGGYAVEATGAGAQAGAFVGLRGNIARRAP